MESNKGNYLINNHIELYLNKEVGIGDWGLGMGPIPNPQSPIPNIY